MELAGIFLAIPPLITETLKAYQTAYRHFRVFRNYSREVKRVYNKFRVQQCLLVSELELLLEKTIEDPSEVQLLLGDFDHVRWQDKSLGTAISRLLGRNGEVYSELLVSIASQLQQFKVDLSCFDALHNDRNQVCRMG